MALKEEPNLRIHLLATGLVTVVGWYVHLAPWEWMLQCLAIGLVWVTELLNTVWENYLDYVSPEHNPQVGKMKDIAAGAVLVAAATAAIVGALIYFPYIWAYFGFSPFW